MSTITLPRTHHLEAPSAAGSPSEARRLLRCLEMWPFLRIERRGLRAFLYGAVGGGLIGTLDLRAGTLRADVGPDLAVRVDLADAASRNAAEALLRRRVDRERFGPQQRMASP
jgi:hypothetical protein